VQIGAAYAAPGYLYLQLSGGWIWRIVDTPNTNVLSAIPHRSLHSHSLLSNGILAAQSYEVSENPIKFFLESYSRREDPLCMTGTAQSATIKGAG
jgi:hypothetical protein